MPDDGVGLKRTPPSRGPFRVGHGSSVAPDDKENTGGGEFKLIGNVTCNGLCCFYSCTSRFC